MKEIEIVIGIITLSVMIASITFLIILAIVATRENIYETSGIKIINHYLIDYAIFHAGEDDDW